MSAPCHRTREPCKPRGRLNTLSPIADSTNSTPHLYDLAVWELPASREPIADTACAVCGARGARPRFRVEEMTARVVVCGVCGLGWFHPMPSPEDVLQFYPETYYTYDGSHTMKFRPLVERLVRIVNGRHVRHLSSGLPPGARVLDVGCGRGVILGPLADRGFEVHGFEHLEVAARGADPRARIRIAPDLAAAGYPAAYFDQVTIWHVLEHLRDPRGTLEEVRRILRPGGRVMVAVPNFESAQARWAGPAWFHLDPPRHLYHFPVSALRRLLESIGFTWEAEYHFSLLQNPFGWIQSALNRLSRLPRNSLYVLLHDQADDRPPFDAATRRRLRVAWIAAAPIALALSVAEAMLRAGGTVNVVARVPSASRPVG